MLLTTQHIKKEGFQKFIERYNLKAKYHKDYPNLVCVSYDQLKTPKNNTTNECRSLVIDLDSLEVIAYPFNRFFDKTPQTKIDYKKAIFLEKIDGSLMHTYVYDGKIHVASKSMPDASGGYKADSNESLAELFFANVNISVEEHQGKSIMWELKHPFGFLTKSNEVTITKIGERDLFTMKETMVTYGTPITFDNEAQLDKYLFGLDPIVSEGLICLTGEHDEFGNLKRYKCKSPQYELISNLRLGKTDLESDRMNSKWLTEIRKYNRIDSFAKTEKYSRFAEEYKKIDTKMLALENLLVSSESTCEGLTSREIFIKYANNPVVASYLVGKQSGKFSSVRQYIAQLNYKQLK